jgi:hypothetical protein
MIRLLGLLNDKPSAQGIVEMRKNFQTLLDNHTVALRSLTEHLWGVALFSETVS